jgi:hypothetical protein
VYTSKKPFSYGEPRYVRFLCSKLILTLQHLQRDKPGTTPAQLHQILFTTGSVTNVTKLAVQGEGGTNDYVTSYEVDHSVDGIVFTNIKNGLKPQVSYKKDNHSMIQGLSVI